MAPNKVKLYWTKNVLQQASYGRGCLKNTVVFTVIPTKPMKIVKELGKEVSTNSVHVGDSPETQAALSLAILTRKECVLSEQCRGTFPILR